MPVDWEDIEPVEAASQEDAVDWNDVEPVSQRPPQPSAQDREVMERMLQPAIAPPMMPEGPDYGLSMAQQFGTPLAPEPKAGQEAMEILEQDLIPVPEPLSAEELSPYFGKTGGKVAAGTMNVLTAPGRFINTPLGLFTAGAGPIIQRLLGLAFAPGMVKGGAEKLGEASAEGDIQKAIEGTGELGFGGLVAYPEAKNISRKIGERVPLTQGDVQRIAYRSLWEQVNNPQMPTSLRRQLEDVAYALQPEAKPILPTVRTQPGESPGQVSIAPSSKEAGQRGSKKRVAEETKVPLSEEDARYIETERAGIDSPIEFVSETTPGQPFAGEIATINRKNGSIVVNAAEFSDWLKSIPARARNKAVRSLLWEERIHLGVDDGSAVSYWNTLTGPEKAIVMRRYSGRWGIPKEPTGLSATDLGHEAIRFRMQQLARMEPREIAEAAFREKWTLKGLTAVESAIRGTREVVGTESAGTGKAIVERMQENLDIAKAIASGSTPAALRKDEFKEPTEDQYAPSAEKILTGGSRPALGEKFFRDAGDKINTPEFWVDYTKRMAKGDLAGQESGFQASIFLRKMGIDEAAPAIAALREARARLTEDIAAWREKLDATADTNEKFRMMKEDPEFALGSVIQFPREIIEAAFAEGGHTGTIPASRAEPLRRPGASEPELSVEGVTPLDYASGRPLTATESLVQRLEGAPAAMRKGKAPKEHPEFFLPPMKQGETRETHAPITPRSVSGEIQAELAGGARHPMSFKGGSATQEAHSFIAGVQRPDFKNFAEQVKSKYGDVQPGQLRDAWINGVWDYLMKAPGTELSRLRSAFGIGKEVGLTQNIADPLPDLPAVQPRLAFEPLGRRPRGVRAIEAQAKTPAQKYRNSIISLLGEKLIRESETGRRQWNRKDVTPDEIGFWRQSEEPAMTAIAPTELSNPTILGKALTADARSEGSTKITRGGQTYQRKAPPVSVTKRLTALLDPKTGKIELVSTYRDPRRGAVLLDPQSPGQTHSPIASMLKRYKPIYSFLLDEPVQNFRKSYKSREEFGEKFLTEARNRQFESATAEATLSEQAGKLFGVEGSEPGMIELENKPGVLEIGGKLTDAEARSFLDNLYDEVSKLESPDDLRLLVDALHEKFASKQLTGRDWQTITTLQKVNDALHKKWPQLTSEQVKDQAFDELYELASKAETGDAFAAQAVQRYAPETGRTLPSESATAPAPQTGRELTMRERIPPTVDPNLPLPKGPGPEPTLPPPKPPEMLTKKARNFVNKMAHSLKTEPKEAAWPYPIETSNPKALRKSKAYVEDEFLKIVGGLYAWNTRRQTTADIVRWRDGAETLANNDARKVGNAVRVQSNKPIVRAAAKAVLASGGDISKLDTYLVSIARGRAKAEAMQARGRMVAGVAPEDAIIARRWIEAADKLKAEVEYAKAHWNDKELREVVRVAREELDAQMDFELLNGVKIDPVRDYVPGRYEEEFFNDKKISFGEAVIGRNFRKPKVFDNYYSAIQAGHYIPKDYDIANLVEHRVRSGRQFVNRDLWMKSLRTLKDPVSGEAVVVQPQMKNGQPVLPNNNYKFISLSAGQAPFAVRKGYVSVLKAMTQPGALSEVPAVHAAMAFNGLLKHGVILILDTFHPGRLGQYALSMMGSEAGYKGGWSALEYRPADIQNAIKQGYVSAKSAAWADQPVSVHMNGRTLKYTRREILNAMQQQGLNVGRIQDAIYSDLVRSWPIVGTLNKWTFDKLTRGLMAESAVRSFEKLNKKYPNYDAGRLMKEVVKDVNIYYGSLGRQGWIRSPTLRELSQIVFLAPQWVEGLVQKELRTYGRILKSPVSLARGEPVMGALGSGMAKGFVGYLVLTQLLNLMSRRKLTFQNPEEGHKLDAWIPTGGEDEGFWVSPMSVFAEVTHDVERLSTKKPTVVEGFRQVGANKLGPFGRMLWVLGTRENEKGQRLTSSLGYAGALGRQLAPAPISIGTPVRYLASKAMPSLVSPPPPGALQQRLLGSGGIKVQPGESAHVQAQHLADEFAEKNNLKKETGFILVPTDEPSYSKLRIALRNGDVPAARENLRELRKGRNDVDIITAMMTWSKRPLTGSWDGELMWLQQMDNDTFKLYSKSLTQRQEVWNKFLEFYMREP